MIFDFGPSVNAAVNHIFVLRRSGLSTFNQRSPKPTQGRVYVRKLFHDPRPHKSTYKIVRECRRKRDSRKRISTYIFSHSNRFALFFRLPHYARNTWLTAFEYDGHLRYISLTSTSVLSLFYIYRCLFESSSHLLSHARGKKKVVVTIRTHSRIL